VATHSFKVVGRPHPRNPDPGLELLEQLAIAGRLRHQPPRCTTTSLGLAVPYEPRADLPGGADLQHRPLPAADDIRLRARPSAIVIAIWLGWPRSTRWSGGSAEIKSLLQQQGWPDGHVRCDARTGR